MCQKIPNLVFFDLWIIGNHAMFFKKTLNQSTYPQSVTGQKTKKLAK